MEGVLFVTAIVMKGCGYSLLNYVH